MAFPVKVGPPTEPYINPMLKARPILGEVEESLRTGATPIGAKDEAAAELAITLFNKFQMYFIIIMFTFEPGLRKDQRWYRALQGGQARYWEVIQLFCRFYSSHDVSS